MTVESALARGRRAARARMLDVCDIQYADGETLDEATGQVVPNMVTRLAGVPCRPKSVGRAITEGEAGGRMAATVVRELELPWDTVGVRAGDVAVLTSIHPTTLPSLAGAALKLDGPAPGGQETALRLQVSEVVS